MTSQNKFINYGLELTNDQLAKILIATKNNTSVVIRLKRQPNELADTSNVLREIPLTQTQINKIQKIKTSFDLKLSAAQLRHLKKSGGFLPLLALLPLIFGGLAAIGGVSHGIASAVSSASSAKAAAAAQSELERHNLAVESQLKNAAGAGIISDKIEHIPVLGKLAPILRKLGLGINHVRKIVSGKDVCLGRGIYLGTSGSGLYIGPKTATTHIIPAKQVNSSGIFLGKGR